MASRNPEYDDNDPDEREREENAAEDWEVNNDPYSDDEKDQMGSSEFFKDND
uniref:Uncharacterized protein n=1 Tax=Ralstonia solanacearum TaxID=305 RepID=A0A0S4V468_RALSL|nr:protein of unknown function [Ralstonia solanacearum]